jgi:hypothetical protein
MTGRRETERQSLTRRCREVLYTTPLGGIVTGSDHEFMLRLVERHRRAGDKVGCGVAAFIVRENQWRKRGFRIIRTDGSETDFSFLKCISHPSHAGEVRGAMRRAVADQVIGFRRPVGRTTCPVTGVRLEAGEGHVDHAPPAFLELADAFAAGRGGYDAIRLRVADAHMGPELADEAFAASWRAYHRAHARLRVVSAMANLSVLRAGGRR